MTSIRTVAVACLAFAVGVTLPAAASGAAGAGDEQPFRSRSWKTADSSDWFELGLFQAFAPVSPELEDGDWDVRDQLGLRAALGTRLMVGPLMVDLGWELSGPLLVWRTGGEPETLIDHGSAGFLRVGEHFGVGVASPPLGPERRVRVSGHFDFTLGFGVNPTYPTLLEVWARPSAVLTIFDRNSAAGSTRGGALVLQIGTQYSRVPAPSERLELPSQRSSGPFAMVGFRALWGTRYRLDQPRPVRPPRPPPRPEAPKVIDTDGDGLADAVDRCPVEAEDRDGLSDGDGCPEVDDDKDGIPDTGDACPVQPEVFNSYYDADGCPDEVPRPLVEFVGVIQGIQFEVDSDRLLPESLPVLDQAAQVLLTFPDVRVHIQGHSSAEGDRQHNVELSWLRSEAVRRYLVSRSVPPDRLRARGYGPDRPIADNESESGRQRNRRVEFKVVKSWQEVE